MEPEVVLSCLLVWRRGALVRLPGTTAVRPKATTLRVAGEAYFCNIAQFAMLEDRVRGFP